MKTPAKTFLALLCAVAVSACSPAASTPDATETTAGPFAITSTDLVDGGTLPDSVTGSAYAWCSGPSESPDIQWTNVPDGTVTLAASFYNETYDFTYWLRYDIPTDVTGAPHGEADHIGGMQGRNSVGLLYFVGPCVEIGETHDLVTTVYALDIEIGERGLSPAKFAEAIEGHVLAQDEIRVTRSGPDA